MYRFRLLFAVVLALSLSACAGHLRMNRVNSLYVGEATADVLHTMGKPSVVAVRENGIVAYSWTRVNLITGYSAIVCLTFKDGKLQAVPDGAAFRS